MLNKNYSKKSGKARKIFLFSVLIIALVGIVLFVLEKKGVTNFYSTSKTDKQTEEITETVNYNPPSDEEKQAADDQKDKIIQQEETRSNNQPQPSKTASVIITDAGQYDDVIEVRAFIPDHYQDGTCTITFTKDNLKVSKDTPAYRDVSTTICTNPNFARSEFQASGDWQVTVTYTSADARGTSSQKVTIQ